MKVGIRLPWLKNFSNFKLEIERIFEVTNEILEAISPKNQLKE